MHRLVRPTIPLAATLLLGGLGHGVASSLAQHDPVRQPQLTFSTITIITDHFPEMLEFYRDVLGFEIARLDEDNHFVEFHSERVNFHFTTRATMKYASGSAKFDEQRKGHAFELAFELATPERVDEQYARIVAQGATPVAAPADKPWGQRIAFFADPDGNIHDFYAKR